MMLKLRSYLLPLLLAIVLGLSGCGDVAGDEGREDGQIVPGAIEEGEGDEEGEADD